MSLISHFFDLFMDAAPWLLLGYLTAALIKVWLPADWLGKHLGGEGIKPVTKAALFGAPLPLCSCGVLPAAMGLRRAGASKGATVSFLVSTPETGVDSVAVSYGLLGPLLAIVRPIAAVASALTAGLLAGRQQDLARPVTAPAASGPASCCGPKVDAPIKSACCGEDTNASGGETQAPAKSGCCGETAVTFTAVSGDSSAVAASTQSGCCESEAKQAEPASCCAPLAKASSQSGCCAGEADQAKVDSCCAPVASNSSKWRQGWRFATRDLVDDSAKWLLIGLVFAALVVTYVPTSFLSQWGGGLSAMVVMILVGIPMYICATASTPIAAGLLLGGVSPGAVLVFLLAGPATNAAAIGLVRQELGNRALLAYLAGVTLPAIAFGYLTNYLAGLWPAGVSGQGGDHDLLPTWLSLGSALVLAALMLASFYRRWWPGTRAHVH
ncbi:SO_0444 family Cu/Zn efflux transporter [Gallaecimonas xiamenensis]|uniref:Permease n=1 Tax=Gallaecimonas xiamenensis 3-C-1 TaxID=745411 RepID=K2JMK6_9GAMM|nr:SO_0444 family Cu/Zn efflux transporter [Gallaecimonas xiamenensis]EKE75642.1 permease [Gallaecimonas xiamenensis 3-C-1]